MQVENVKSIGLKKQLEKSDEVKEINNILNNINRNINKKLIN